MHLPQAQQSNKSNKQQKEMDSLGFFLDFRMGSRLLHCKRQTTRQHASECSRKHSKNSWDKRSKSFKKKYLKSNFEIYIFRRKKYGCLVREKIQLILKM